MIGFEDAGATRQSFYSSRTIVDLRTCLNRTIFRNWSYDKVSVVCKRYGCPLRQCVGNVPMIDCRLVPRPLSSIQHWVTWRTCEQLFELKSRFHQLSDKSEILKSKWAKITLLLFVRRLNLAVIYYSTGFCLISSFLSVRLEDFVIWKT